MDDQVTIGARVRVLRKWRDMTQVQLAGLAGLSQGFLSQIENGKLALDRRSHVAALATALRVSEIDIIGGPHLSADPVQSEPHAVIEPIRLALQTNTLWSAAVEHARPVRELAAFVAGPLDQWHRRDDYIAMGRVLPKVLDELHLHVADPKDEADQRAALRTLVMACHSAATICKNLRYPNLAYFAGYRAAEAARMLDDPIAIGQATFSLVLNTPHVGGWSRVLDMAEDAANTLEPHVSGDLGIQVLGMLTLTASMNAAAACKYGQAEHWLSEADQLAARVPDDLGVSWRGFSATNVNIWRISVGIERGETGAPVLKAADRVDVSKLAVWPSRKACLFADVGRGLARDKKTKQEAEHWLLRAEKIAPQRIRNDAKVHETVAVLLEQVKDAAVSRELRGMAARMGIPH